MQVFFRHYVNRIPKIELAEISRQSKSLLRFVYALFLRVFIWQFLKRFFADT